MESLIYIIWWNSLQRRITTCSIFFLDGNGHGNRHNAWSPCSEGFKCQISMECPSLESTPNALLCKQPLWFSNLVKSISFIRQSHSFSPMDFDESRFDCNILLAPCWWSMIYTVPTNVTESWRVEHQPSTPQVSGIFRGAGLGHASPP